MLKYIEEGYAWAETSGYEVVPVIPTKGEMWLCSPVPGRNAPHSLIEAARLRERLQKNELSGIKRRSTDLKEIVQQHQIAPRVGDILFSPSYWHDNDPEIYYSIKQTGCKVAILIHDILPITQAPFYLAPWKYHFAAAVLQAADYADLLYCVSSTTKEAVEAFAGQRGLLLPPVIVAQNGYQPLVSTTTAKQLREGLVAPHVRDPLSLKALASNRPLLMVGSIEPKKGHIPAIKAIEALWGAGYPRDLIIVGRRGWMEQQVVDHIVNSPCYGSRLFWLTDIDDHDLAYAYSKCHALIFASLDEGFGIPMIEAAKFGKPVVVFDTKIANEVIGSHSLVYDEASSLMEQLVLLEDIVKYESVCNHMSSFDWPTWTETVPSVLDSLTENLGLSARNT